MKTLIITLWTNPAAAKKFIVALIGAVVLAGSAGLLPTPFDSWVAVVGPFIIAGGVWAVPNQKRAGSDEVEGYVDNALEYPRGNTFKG